MPSKRKRTTSKPSRKPATDDVDRRAGRVKRIERWGDDIEEDEDTMDAFELQKDRISVDMGEQARKQRLEDADALGAGEEVLALDLPEDSDSEEGAYDDEEEEVEEEEEEEAAVKVPRQAKDHAPLPSKLGISRYDRPAQEDEELYEAADVRGAYHVGRNEDDEPDSSDEEAQALNLAEVLRLQRAAREQLRYEDYGVPEPTQKAAEAVDQECVRSSPCVRLLIAYTRTGCSPLLHQRSLERTPSLPATMLSLTSSPNHPRRSPSSTTLASASTASSLQRPSYAKPNSRTAKVIRPSLSPTSTIVRLALPLRNQVLERDVQTSCSSTSAL